MKKFFKFITCIVSLTAIGYTGYSLYKKYVEKDVEADDDFDDSFEDDSFKEGKSKREYVTINLDK